MMSAEDIANFHSEIIDLQSFEEVSTMSAEDTSNLHAEVTDLQSNEEASPMSEGNSILHAKMADLQSNEEASSMSTEGNSILHTEVMDLQSNEEVSTSNASTVVDECTPTPSATNINIAASSEFSQVVPPSPLLINAEASSSAINNGSSKPCHSPSHSSPRINEGASSSAINDGSSKSCHSPSHSCPIINEGASSSAMNNKSSKLCQCPDHAVHKISDNALHAIVKSGNKKKASSSGIKKKSSKIFKRFKYNPYAPLLPEHIKGLTRSKIKQKTTVPSDIHGKSSTSSTSVPAKTFRINEGASTSKADDDEDDDDDDDDDDSIFVVPAPPPPRQPTPLKRILTIPLHPKFRIGDKVLIKIQCKEVCAEIIKPPYDVLQKMLPGSHYVRCLADETCGLKEEIR